MFESLKNLFGGLRNQGKETEVKDMFENYRKFSFDFEGRPLVVETGKIAQLANGSALVRYGETVILATATASAAPREGIDFLPLSVDFEEERRQAQRKGCAHIPRYRQTYPSAFPQGSAQRRLP